MGHSAGQSFLRDLIVNSCFPALKRWAIGGCPYGTSRIVPTSPEKTHISQMTSARPVDCAHQGTWEPLATTELWVVVP
jgi:hypothetical protein